MERRALRKSLQSAFILVAMTCAAATAFAQSGPPTNLHAKVTNGAVQLSWNAPQLGVATRYVVYRAMAPATNTSPSTLSFMKIDATSRTSFTDKSAAKGSIYVYYVTAVGKNGQESSRSNTVTVNLPLAGGS